MTYHAFNLHFHRFIDAEEGSMSRNTIALLFFKLVKYRQQRFDTQLTSSHTLKLSLLYTWSYTNVANLPSSLSWECLFSQ
jgi:hypothetical protein